MIYVNYLSASVPSSYKCDTCGVTNCKLWRESGAFFMPVKLECVDCSIKSQNNSKIAPYFSTIATTVIVREDGTYLDKYGITDQIGWREPAVPTEDNESYWGYTTVPKAGVQWWKSLPLRSME